MAKNLTANQKRCEDCVYLVESGGKWCCDQCFKQLIEDIDDCPEGFTLDEIEQANQKAKENKVKNIARSEGEGEGKTASCKPRERKPDVEKETIISETAKFLETITENVKITNISKIIEFDINGNHYKFDLIRQRKPKN